MRDYDAIIIGAGLAGNAAAIHLSKAGKRVLLLEKAAVPQDRICGEFLNQAAQRHLCALGLNLEAQGAVRIDRLRLLHGRNAIETALAWPGLSLSRRTLDAALLERAAAAGAEIRMGCKVTELKRETSNWQVNTEQGRFSAACIFLATGKQDVRGMPRPVTFLSNIVAFKMHYQLAPPQSQALTGGTELALFAGGYAGLEMVEEEKANLCLVVSKTIFQACGKSWEGMLDHLSLHCPLLMERLSTAQPVWSKPLAIANVPYGFVYRMDARAPADLYRLGDQMAVIPSFCGDGMSIALSSARLAAEHFLHADAARYHRACRKLFLPRILTGKVLACLIASSFGQTLLYRTIETFPNLIHWMQQRTSLR